MEDIWGSKVRINLIIFFFFFFFWGGIIVEERSLFMKAQYEKSKGQIHCNKLNDIDKLVLKAWRDIRPYLRNVCYLFYYITYLHNKIFTCDEIMPKFSFLIKFQNFQCWFLFIVYAKMISFCCKIFLSNSDSRKIGDYRPIRFTQVDHPKVEVAGNSISIV